MIYLLLSSRFSMMAMEQALTKWTTSIVSEFTNEHVLALMKKEIRCIADLLSAVKAELFQRLRQLNEHVLALRGKKSYRDKPVNSFLDFRGDFP